MKPLRNQKNCSLREIVSPKKKLELSRAGSQSVANTGPEAGTAYIAQMMFKSGAGCRVSFAAVYRLTSNQVFAVILRINRDRSEAEDVLQETYFNAWTRAHWFDQSKGEVLAWLVTIARHRAIDSLRHKQHRPQVQWQTEELNDAYANQTCQRPGPLELTVQRSERQLIAGHLVGLPAMQRQSVVLAFYEGLSHPEIALHLDKPLGSVKSWVRRGLSGLKTRIAGA